MPEPTETGHRRLCFVLCMIGGLLSVASVPAARAENSGGINRALVAAATLMDKAKRAPSAWDRVLLVHRVGTILAGIVRNHPESDAAMRLATGQAIGVLSRDAIARARIGAHADPVVAACAGEIRACLLRLAVENAEQMAEGPARARSFAYIAAKARDLALFERARREAELLRPPRRESALQDVAMQFAEIGEFDRALAIVERLATTGHAIGNDFVLARIAYRQIGAGRFREALRTSERVSQFSRGGIFAEIAAKAADRALREEAIEASRRLTEPSARVIALAVVAGEVSRPSLLEEAIDAAMAQKQQYARDAALRTIAGVVAALGDASRAVNVADEITSTSLRYPAYNDVCGALAERGAYSDAFRIAGTISDPFWSARAISRIAWEIAAHDPKAIALVIPEADRIRDENSRFDAWESISKAFAETGDFDKAIAFAGRIESPTFGQRRRAFAAVAAALAPTDFDRAWRLLEAETHALDEERAGALAMIAASLARRGERIESIAVVSAIGDRQIRLKAFADLISVGAR